MNRSVRFGRLARAEANSTQDWYELRRAGLGAEFRDALEEAIARIADSPFQYQRVHGETRRVVLRRFPHAVYFRATEDEVVVLALVGRQDPQGWQTR
ncbi:MAG: type II toxin-antitoxin system RelE/ParE family toxin [Dehalococcoidia bacterium]